MLDLFYRVSDSTPAIFEREVEIDGETGVIKQEGVLMQLVPERGDHTTIGLRLLRSQSANWGNLAPGDRVKITIVEVDEAGNVKEAK